MKSSALSQCAGVSCTSTTHLQWIYLFESRLSFLMLVQGRSEGLRGHTFPGAESLWGLRMSARGAENSQQCHKYFLQCNAFASEWPQVQTLGHQTWFLPTGAKKILPKLLLRLLSELFKPLLCRTWSRGRCWAAIRLSHRSEPSGHAVHGEVDGLDIVRLRILKSCENYPTRRLFIFVCKISKYDCNHMLRIDRFVWRYWINCARCIL